MGLIYRNGPPYLYRSVRRSGRVTSEYGGSGETALLIARLERIERDKRGAERVESKAERERIEAVEQELVDYFEQVEDFARASLHAAGFHHPKRQWRKRRGRLCDA